MKYTVNLTHSKESEKKSATTAEIKDSNGKNVEYSDILLSLNPKISLLWDDYKFSGLNPLRFTGTISFLDAFDNANSMQMSIEVYTKRLVSYYINVAIQVSTSTDFNL